MNKALEENGKNWNNGKEALDLAGRNALGCNSLKSGVQLEQMDSKTRRLTSETSKGVLCARQHFILKSKETNF